MYQRSSREPANEDYVEEEPQKLVDTREKQGQMILIWVNYFKHQYFLLEQFDRIICWLEIYNIYMSDLSGI